MSQIRFSTDGLPYPVQETTTDNTTPLVVSKSKNDKSATCLINHDCKSYADKSTQTPVLFDKCLTPVEYESMTGKLYQCSESSTACNQTPIPFDECLSSLGYESMTEKPYQCSESSTEMTECSETFIKLSPQPTPTKMGPGFLVYGCDSAGKKPNVHNIDHTTDDIMVTSLAVLQHKSEYDKSANCLTNERSNPIGPLDHTTQISVPSDECLSTLEYEFTTAIAQQCTEGFPCKSGNQLVTASTIPQEIDCTLPVSSPEGRFWPYSKMIDKHNIDYKTAECDEKTLLLPILRHFQSTSGKREEVEQDI